LGTTWYLIGTATFTTEQLGASSLNAATWTVYYYLSMSGTIGKNTYVYFFWDGPYPSRIENFTWTPAPTKTWHDVASWTFQLLTRKWNNISSFALTLQTRAWQNIASWTFNLLTKGWHETATWIFQLQTQKWREIASWIFELATKKWYEIGLWNFQTLTRKWNSIASWTWQIITYGWHTITLWHITIGGTDIPILFIGILFFVAILTLTFILAHER
jgi:hypothetical protein